MKWILSDNPFAQTNFLWWKTSINFKIFLWLGLSTFLNKYLIIFYFLTPILEHFVNFSFNHKSKDSMTPKRSCGFEISFKMENGRAFFSKA